jgi:hypothetical protein
MEGNPEYEEEQTQYQHDDNYMTEGEYLEAQNYPEGVLTSDMGLAEQYMYLENESNDLDINAMLEDIESRQPLFRNGHQHCHFF